MKNVLKKSGWTVIGSNEGSLSVGKSSLSLSVSAGELFLNDPLGANYKFNFGTTGVGLSCGPFPLGLDLTTTDLPSRGMIYTNSKWRNTLSPSDFKGAFLAYQGKGILSHGSAIAGAGGSASIIFFDIGMGLYTSLVATMATAGYGAVISPTTVIASCSAVFLSVGTVLGTIGGSLSGAVGIIHSFEKKESDVVGIWKVSSNGKNFKYAYYSNGSCSWWNDMNMLNPDGAGRWNINGDYLEINWDSGSFEQWEMPLSFQNQKGKWTDSSGRVSSIIANKTDITSLFK